MLRFAAVLSIFAALPAHAACVDLLQKDQLSFVGVLRNSVFPGAPNFADVRKGDAPEPTYILDLVSEACAQGDGTIQDGTPFRTVHLYSANEDASVWNSLRRLIGRKVHVWGDAAFGAQTGHHHAPVVVAVAAVAEIRDAEAVAQTREVQDTGNVAPAREREGDPRTTVEAFYAALAAGNGQQASQLVVPEKRRSGPFSAAEITRFYGSLTDPLRPLAVTPLGAGRYRVRYTYQAGGKRCDGVSVVSTRRVGDLNLIGGIRAVRGC